MNIKKWLQNKKMVSKNFWLQYENKFVLLVGFVLIAVISFEAGLIKNQEISKKNPLIIEKPIAKIVEGANTKKTSPVQALHQKKEATSYATHSKNKCLYVGSKNSHMYHLPNSSYAKRIKTENIICFSDKNEAESKGYRPDKSLSR